MKASLTMIWLQPFSWSACVFMDSKRNVVWPHAQSDTLFNFGEQARWSKTCVLTVYQWGTMWGGGASLFSWHSDQPFLLFVNCDLLKNWSLSHDWSALHETWMAKILDCVHIHWRSIKENRSLIWPNNLNYHLVAWLNFTFESFDVTSQFSVFRPTYS